MIRFATAEYVDGSGSTALARQIAKYCAAGGGDVGLVTQSNDYEKIKEKDTEVAVARTETDLPDNVEIIITDYGNAQTKVVKPADKVYVVVDARKFSAEKLSKYLNSASYECELVLYGTNDMSEYKELVTKVIKVAGIETGECQYEVRMALDLMSHQKGFTVPDPSEPFRYAPIAAEAKPADAAPEKTGPAASLGSILPFGRKNKQDENDLGEEEDDGAEDYTSRPGQAIEYEDDGSWQSKLAELKDAAAGGVGDLVSAMKERSKRKKEEKANAEDKSGDGSDKEGKKDRRSRQDKEDDIPKTNDWAKKTKALDTRAKLVSQIFSVINALLIISVVIMAITTFVAFRDSKHKMVTLKELSKTEYPVKVETDGVSVKPYSGFAKNKKVAIIIGDDSFIKKDSKKFQNLAEKNAVETRKYEITVTYTDNPLLQQMFGTLTFVHHSAFGEGDFSPEETAAIMDYSKKWFTKKRYDLLRFNDRDTINVNDPPDSLVRYVGKDD